MRIDEDNDQDSRTVFCGNLYPDVTESILFELFHQAGPVEAVRRPRDPSGKPKAFAFIVYKHECSVPYALEIFRGVKLFNRNININSRSTLRHVPVLDTHITEFTEPRTSVREREQNFQDNDAQRYHDRENRRDRHAPYENHRQNSSNKNRHSQREKDSKEPTSWAELNALRGKNLAYGNSRSDLQGSSDQLQVPNNGQQMIPDFNMLLQMGQQMFLSSGMMGFGGLPLPNSMPLLGGLNPHMQGGMGGNERYSPERERGRRDHVNDRRESRRGHPYDDRGRQDDRRYHDNNRRNDDYRRQDDHRRHEDPRVHDRGYSSSRSSHDRERRDRRSR